MSRKIKKRTIVPYVLLISTCAVAVFFMFRSRGLESKIQKNEDEKISLQRRMADYERLFRIDSMLVEGNFDKVLNSYNESAKSIDDGNRVIPLRIALAEKMLELRARANTIKDTLSENLDSLRMAAMAIPKEVRQFDSLSFALEKSKVQLARMRQQLKVKSFGEYLTFKSEKGNQMHYVGEVKGKMANGFGIALLDTGSRYEGEWKDNQRHGEGTFYWPDGEYYQGSYLNDQRNGTGTYYWPNKEKYTGQWKEDKRNGEGIFYGKDGEVVTSGIWKDDKLVEENKD